MIEPPRSATCARCGTWNVPRSARCAACGVALQEALGARRRDAGADRTARLAGIVLILGSALVIAVLLPSLVGGGAASPAPSAVALVQSDPRAPTPTASAPASPSASASASAIPSPTPRPSPTPTPGTDDPGADAEHALGGDAPAATEPPAPNAPKTVKLPSLSVDIAGATKISYFAISGRSPADLVRSMEKNARSRCDREALACVSLRPDIQPTYRITSTGSCLLTGATTSLRAVVYMPRWTKPTRVYPELLTWWRSVLDHIEWHEGRHIRIEKSWLKKAPAMYEGKACSSAQRITERWVKKVADAQAAFDAKDYAEYDYPAYDGPGGFFGN